MKPHWEQLYSQLLIELNRCKAMDLPEMEIAESCFRASFKYWEELKTKFMNRTMQIDEEEKEFFREVKPQFTCHIEYYLILNQGLLFIPVKPDEQKVYWEEEAKRYKRFCDLNENFIRYYEGKRQDLDRSYFLERNNNQGFLPQERIYQDIDCRSSHDNLVRSYLANKMYNDYVKGRLEELKKGYEI